MKRTLFLILLIVSITSAFAAHIVGGEMIYEYVGPGNLPNTTKYKITLRLFRDQQCRNCAAMPDTAWIGIFDRSNNGAQYPGNGSPYIVRKSREDDVAVSDLPPCINNAPNLEYRVGLYEFTVDLPNNADGYTASYQTCCRINPLENVYNTQGSGGTGSTYSCDIPGLNALSAGEFNSSPQFAMNVSVICQDRKFNLDFSATDPDGDQLVYTICEAYNGGGAQGAAPYNPAKPPYNSVGYINGFTATTPLGSNITINPATGFISGIAPKVGGYVVCVCIQEYRRGKLIGIHRKDFIVNVDDCDFAGAVLDPTYMVCDSFSTKFSNQSTSSLNKTYYWDFGDGSTSTEISPTHNYADTGVYNVKLVINRNDPCADSTTTAAKVYPGFKPAFTFDKFCVNKPTQFIDGTQSTYGVPNSWRWDFGDFTTNADTSRSRTPSYTYKSTGNKIVNLTASDTKGCTKTISDTVTIMDRPPIQLAFRDTLICNIDSLQLRASGIGSFSWTPLTNIFNENTATPTVFPKTTTTYHVRLDMDGCINTDSLRVRVVDHVTLQVMPDTTICLTDQVRLNATTDGLRYVWTNAATLDNANALRPLARPTATTTYQLTSFIGKCSATGDVVITAVPYPVAHAGADTTICYHTSAQLQASMVGKNFTWTPSTYLDNPQSLTPVSTPARTQAYVLSVYDDLGCPKPKRDTVVVYLLPKINASAGRDTAVVIGQPLQFLATGGTSYEWMPGTSLNRTDIADPIGIYNGGFDTIRYKVVVTKLTDEVACMDSAYVTVKIFRTIPQVFVPTAFTPNGDGKNDRIRPIAVGIKNIEYFRVYNRWGQLVFSTTINGYGWDGRINGKEQGTATYVWMVKATDYLGKNFVAKGTVTLIR